MQAAPRQDHSDHGTAPRPGSNRQLRGAGFAAARTKVKEVQWQRCRLGHPTDLTALHAAIQSYEGRSANPEKRSGKGGKPSEPSKWRATAGVEKLRARRSHSGVALLPLALSGWLAVTTEKQLIARAAAAEIGAGALARTPELPWVKRKK